VVANSGADLWVLHGGEHSANAVRDTAPLQDFGGDESQS